MSLASLFILRGSSGHWRPGMLIAGIALALITFALALYLALRPLPGREGRNPKLMWPLVALGLWYLALAAAASLAGPGYAVAGLLAGLIPLTGLALMLAVARRKTAVDDDGRRVDISADDGDDPFPGFGMDDHETMAGDTPERPDHPQHEEQTERRRRVKRAEEQRSSG
jgi:hypothetical protein